MCAETSLCQFRFLGLSLVLSLFPFLFLFLFLCVAQALDTCSASVGAVSGALCESARMVSLSPAPI